MFVIIFLFSAVFGISYLRRRFMSPYTLTYIFGLKGAGKSTYMAKLMLSDIRHGWTVYTNMEDIRIPGVRIITSRELLDHVPPPHSALYIDEAGLVWDNRAFASFQHGYVEYFKLQRKYKNKVVMNSQALDVDKKIRDLIDRMIMVNNLLGCVGLVRPIRRTISVLEAQGNAESRLALNLKFEGLMSVRFFWLPKYWKWFDSFAAPARPAARFKQVEGVPPSRFSWRVPMRKLRLAFARHDYWGKMIPPPTSSS